MKKIYALAVVGVIGGVFVRGIPTAAVYGMAGCFIGALVDAIDAWGKK